MADGTEDGVPVELVILLVGGVVVFYVFAGANRWWDGYRKQHNLLGQVAAVTAFVLVALWFTQSSSGARVADLVLLAVLVLVAGAVVASIVAGRRRKARLAAMSADAARASATRRGSPRWNTERDDSGREVVVYAVAAFDSRTGDVRAIKIGSTASRDDLREAQVIAEQVGRMNVGKPLGRGPGGTRREQDLHRRLDTWRHPKSEWFAPSPEVIAAVGELDSLTNDGRQFLRTMAARRGA